MSHNANQTSSGALDSFIPKIQHLDINANPQSATGYSDMREAATDGTKTNYDPINPFSKHKVETCRNFHETRTCRLCLLHYRTLYMGYAAMKARAAAAADLALKDAVLEIRDGGEILEELRPDMGEEWYKEQCKRFGRTEKEVKHNRNMIRNNKGVEEMVNSAGYLYFKRKDDGDNRMKAEVKAIMEVFVKMREGELIKDSEKLSFEFGVANVLEKSREDDFVKREADAIAESNKEKFKRFRREEFEKLRREALENQGQDEEMDEHDEEEGMLVDTEDAKMEGDGNGEDWENVRYDENDENMCGVSGA